jgi:hypothetical protein
MARRYPLGKLMDVKNIIARNLLENKVCDYCNHAIGNGPDFCSFKKSQPLENTCEKWEMLDLSFAKKLFDVVHFGQPSSIEDYIDPVQPMKSPSRRVFYQGVKSNVRKRRRGDS